VRKVKAADWATGVFGAALVGLLFAPWFTSFAPHSGIVLSKGGWTAYAPVAGLLAGSYNAWEALTVIDIVLLIAGLAGIWVLVATATQATPAVPIASTAFAIFGGLISSVLIAVRLIWPPDLGPGPTARGSGAWLALDAAIGLTLAALVSMRDERRSAPAPVPITTLPGEA
jgi:hypothetical protein